MDSSEKKQISKIQQLKEGTVFKQKLQNSKFSVQYQSQSSVGQFISKQSTGTVKVQGTFSRNKEDFFNKTTRISIGDNVFIIKEHFGITSFQKQEPTKIQIPKKQECVVESEESSAQSSSESYDGAELRRNDRKNIVKNVVKAYSSWMRKHDKKLESNSSVRHLVQSFIKQGKFNNSLVVSIIKDSRLNPSFCNFLTNEASRWLFESKIVDKTAHKQCIQLYLKACNTMNLNELRVFKRKTNLKLQEMTGND